MDTSLEKNIWKVLSKVLITIVLISKAKPFDIIDKIFGEKLNRTEIDFNRCIESKSQILDMTDIMYHTHLVSIGTVLRLKCGDLCLKPEESLDNLWVFMSAKSLRMNVRSNETHLLKDLSLEVSFKHLNDSSTYYCIHNSTIYAVHQITVTDSEPIDLNFVRSNETMKPVINLDDYGIQVFTQWSEWSSCNRCPIGLKKRIGICKIRKNKSQNLLIDDTFNMSGIPCRSQYLPKEITSLNEIQKERSQILFTFCRKECPQKDSTNITKQIIIEKLSKYRKIIKSSEIKVVSVGEKVVISCNKAFDSKYYIWRNSSNNVLKKRFYYINPMKVHYRTHGRVKIDFMNNLVINYVLESDERLFSCYDLIINSTISMTKLVVRSKVKEITLWSNFKEHFITLVLVFAIISFGFTLWNNRNLITKI